MSSSRSEGYFRLLIRAAAFASAPPPYWSSRKRAKNGVAAASGVGTAESFCSLPFIYLSFREGSKVSMGELSRVLLRNSATGQHLSCNFFVKGDGLKVLVAFVGRDDRCGRGERDGGAVEGARLPVVGARLLGQPGRERDEEVAREAVDVRLVQAAQRAQVVVRVRAVAQAQSREREKRAQPSQVFVGHSLAVEGDGARVENLRDVHDGVSGHREREPRLPLVRAVYADEDERASVEHARQRGEPGLVVVLRAVVAEHGIREVTFEQVRGPALPLL